MEQFHRRISNSLLDCTACTSPFPTRTRKTSPFFPEIEQTPSALCPTTVVGMTLLIEHLRFKRKVAAYTAAHFHRGCSGRNRDGIATISGHFSKIDTSASLYRRFSQHEVRPELCKNKTVLPDLREQRTANPLYNYSGMLQ